MNCVLVWFKVCKMSTSIFQDKLTGAATIMSNNTVSTPKDMTEKTKKTYNFLSEWEENYREELLKCSVSSHRCLSLISIYN